MPAGSWHAAQQAPLDPDGWRIGVRSHAGADERFRYGVFLEQDGECYRVRFDDAQKSDLVPIAGTSFDWVQPNSQMLAKQAQKGAPRHSLFPACGSLNTAAYLDMRGQSQVF